MSGVEISPVHAAINDTDINLDRMAGLIDNLGDKLQGSLTPERPQPCSTNSTAAPAPAENDGSELSESLRAFVRRVDYHNSRISQLVTRCEL